jgi:hypothetical protein
MTKGPQENNLPVLSRHGPGLPPCHVQKGGCLKAHCKVGSVKSDQLSRIKWSCISGYSYVF